MVTDTGRLNMGWMTAASDDFYGRGPWRTATHGGDCMANSRRSGKGQ